MNNTETLTDLTLVAVMGVLCDLGVSVTREMRLAIRARIVDAIAQGKMEGWNEALKMVLSDLEKDNSLKKPTL